MSPEFFIAIVAGLGGMLGWGLADFFAKKTIDRIGDVVSLAWAGAFGSIVFIAAALYRVGMGGTLSFPHDAPTWLLLAFFGALQAAVYLFAYRAFSKGQIALLNPIFASFSGIVALISIFFLREASGPLQLAFVAVIFAGVLCINIDVAALRGHRIKFLGVPGFREIVIATFLAALWTVLWDLFVKGQDSLAYALAMFVFMTIAVFAFAFARGLPVRVRDGSIWLFLFLIGACETVAYLAITYGYGATSYVSVVSVLSGAFSLPTILLARVFLKEKVTGTQALGSFVIIAGIVLLALV